MNRVAFETVDGTETKMGGPQRAFQSTLWSLVLRAKNPDSGDRRQALETLIHTYWKPLYSFVRRKGKSVDDSKDLTQGFFSDLLAKDFLKYVDRGRGRFRTFLLTALEHYMCDEHDRTTAQKRGDGRPTLSLDFEGAEGDALSDSLQGKSPDQTFLRDWAVRVLSQALENVRAFYQKSSQDAEFQAFQPHLTALRPSDTSYHELSKALGITVEDVRNRIRVARGRYRDAILTVIRSYTGTADEAHEELRELLSAFS